VVPLVKYFLCFCAAFYSGTSALFAANVPDGASLSLWWGIPFAGLLLSLALFPLLLPRIWHHHYGKIGALWASATLIPMVSTQGTETTFGVILEILIHHYIPFITLIAALYIISSGIKIHINAAPVPRFNVAVLAIGTFLANFIGTTGAAMLLVRPLLAMNQSRQHKVHTMVFFIFLVCNIGGSLTPLGDPPLFLGFLNGVSFFWVTEYLFIPLLLIAIPLLLLYWALDHYYLRRENIALIASPPATVTISGSIHFVFLGITLAIVFLSAVWHPDTHLNLGALSLPLEEAVRDLGLIAISFLSWKTNQDLQGDDKGAFSWEPLYEVGKLFASIFIVAIPVIAILQAGEKGALQQLVALVNKDGQPIPSAYFWLTGALSAFLDNAPTYLIFFNTAGGNAANLMSDHALTLTAISAGAVFMGAITYIGNAPNFMVKAIAESEGVPMPSFFGYLKWSCTILLPLFILLTVALF
jgi:Na+/H+ antiporter NhaD/arsenite permease-like protein